MRVDETSPKDFFSFEIETWDSSNGWWSMNRFFFDIIWDYSTLRLVIRISCLIRKRVGFIRPFIVCNWFRHSRHRYQINTRVLYSSLLHGLRCILLWLLLSLLKIFFHFISVNLHWTHKISFILHNIRKTSFFWLYLHFLSLNLNLLIHMLILLLRFQLCCVARVWDLQQIGMVLRHLDHHHIVWIW